MNRKHFGHLIAALRKEHFDPIAGKGWSQKFLAQKANLSYKTVSNLEQGCKVNLDAESLVRLANALGLTTLERQEFFAVANTIDDEAILCGGKKPDYILRELLNTLRSLHVPAFLHDAFYDIIAVNSLAIGLHSIDDEFLLTLQRQTGGFNFLGLVFAPESPMRITMVQEHHKLSLLSLQQFSAMSLRYRHTTNFKDLFTKLRRYPEFSNGWAESRHHPQNFYSSLKTYNYNHLKFSQISYTVTLSTIFTDTGNLYLSALVPCTLATVKAFDYLIQRFGVSSQRLADWPKTLTVDFSDEPE